MAGPSPIGCPPTRDPSIGAHLIDRVAAFHFPRLYLSTVLRCASPQVADKPLTDLATPGDLAVAPLAPFRIGQEEQHGFPLIGVGPRQAVVAVGRDRPEQGVA